MRAALMEAAGRPLVLAEDVQLEEPGPGEVRVRITHCGICRSDLHLLEGRQPIPVPAILGHEAAGVVEAAGAGETPLRAGDKVVLALHHSCRRCFFCARGEGHLCAALESVPAGTLPDGTTRLSRRGRTVYRGLGVGALAERVVLPAAAAIRVPEDTPLQLACLLGCAVQTGVGAVLNTAHVQEGDTLLVMGLGGVGLAIVQGARVAGASRILAYDPLPGRRAHAAALGATDLLEVAEEQLPARVRELTDRGVDFAFDAVGAPHVIEGCLKAIRRGGTVVCVGAPPPDASFRVGAAFMFAMGEKRLVGCFMGSSRPERDIPHLLELWRTGRLDLARLVTRRCPLEEAQAAFDDLRAGIGLRTVVELSP